MVPARPLLEEDGLVGLAQLLEHVEVLGVPGPTWMTSTSSKRSRLRMSMSSVTMGRPVAFLASSSRRMPRPPDPGSRRGGAGLKAPPEEGRPGLLHLLGHR